MLFAIFLLKQTCDKKHVNSGATRRKPHSLSGSITSATCIKSRLSITLAKILPPTDNSKMPRLLPQLTRSPLFLYMATMHPSIVEGIGKRSRFCRWRHASGHGGPFPHTKTPQLVGDLRHRLCWIWDQRWLIELQSGWVVLSRQVMRGSEGRESGKEVSEGSLLFRRVLKCSAHRERIPSRFLLSNVLELSFAWQN